MKKIKSLHDLLVDQVRDLYYAEKQIAKALPKMAKKAQSEELKAAFEHHAKETDNQIDRLEKVFSELEINPRGKTCPAIDGILEEGKEIMDELDTHILDVGLIAAAQKVEHYEIASYGCIRTYARLLNLPNITSLLNDTIKEEGNADKTLTRLAEEINVEALEEESAEEEEE